MTSSSMDNQDHHYSLSSYDDLRHHSFASFDLSKPPPAKVLLDGYRDNSSRQTENVRQYNAYDNPRRTPSPTVLDRTDPVVMYLLSEIAIGDSKDYEVLSLEKVDFLKREHSLLTGRLDACRRKLALEIKVCDAAKSLNRLYSSKIKISSGGVGSISSPKSRQSCINKFDQSTGDGLCDELAVATRKCEDLAHEVWTLEREKENIQRALLQHTAGVLQMTHKGLKKSWKSGIPRTPESTYGRNSRESADGFDDRTLYRVVEDLDEFTENDRYAARGQHDHELTPTGGGIPYTMPDDELEKQLAGLIFQLQGLITQCGAPSSAELLQTDPSGGLRGRLAYLGAVANSLQSRIDDLLNQKSILTTQIQQQRELNSKSDAEKDAYTASLVEQLAVVRKELQSSGHENQSVKEELDFVLEQLEATRKDLSTHKEHIDELASEKETRARTEENLLRLESEFERSEHEKRGVREELNLAVEQLETLRRDLAIYKEDANALVSEKEARTRAEGDIQRLEIELEQRKHKERGTREELDLALDQLQTIRSDLATYKEGADALAVEKEIRVRVENDVLRLESELEQSEREKQETRKELGLALGQLENFRRDLDVYNKDVGALALEKEAKKRVEEDLRRLECELEQSEREKQDTREELGLALEQLEICCGDLAARKEDADVLASERKARARAEEDLQRLASEFEQLRSDATRVEQADARAEQAATDCQRAEKQGLEIQLAMQQLRTECDTQAKKATDMYKQAESEIIRLGAQLKDATEARIRAEENCARKQTEMSELEGEVARAQTKLTVVEAELDSAYGSRAERAAEVASNPAIQKEIDDLKARNIELTEELAAIKSGPGEGDLLRRVQILERELREAADEFGAMTRASIEFEKDREKLDGIIDGLRERCEQLEIQISENRIHNMGISSPNSAGRDGTLETTSTMVLKNEFKKMMRDTRAENMKILRAEQEERKKLEALLRTLRKEYGKSVQTATTS